MKLFNFIKLMFLITLCSFNSVVFAEYGTPSAYIVTVNSMDLCTDSSCSSFVRLGSTSKSFNIASVSAGADIGTFVDEVKLVVGKSYTHARWNLNRAMTLKGTVTVGGSVTCATSANGTAGTETVTAYNAASQTEANLSLFMVDLLKGGDGSWPTALNYTSKGVQLVSNDFPSATTFDYIKRLDVAYTVSEEPPEIKMSFDVTNRLGAGYNNSGSEQNGVPNTRCYYWVEDPSPSISIK